MSAVEYAAKFYELTRFAPIYVATNEMRMERFEHGLKGKLKEAIVGHSYINLNEMYQKAIKIARVVHDTEATEREEV